MPIPTQIAGSRPVPKSRGSASQYRVSREASLAIEGWNDVAQSAKEGLGVYNDMVQRDKLRETVGFENDARRDMMDLLYGNEEAQGLYSQNGQNAIEIDRQFENGFRSIKEKYLSQVKDPELHEKFSRTLDNMYTSNYGSIKRYQMKERQAASSLMMTSGIALSNDRIGLEFNNDETFAQELGNIRSAAMARGKIDGLKGDPLNALVKTEVSKSYLQRFNALTAQDDIGAQEKAFDMYMKADASDELTFDAKIKMQETLEKLKPQIMAKKAFTALQGPAISDEGMIEFVMNDLEGGDKIVPDGKGRARWGINEYWNPEVDLDSMTFTEAKEVAKEKYMSRVDKTARENGIDLTPQARLVAFDAMFNHRLGFGEDILKRSNGDVDKMITMRSNEYDRLAKSDPDQYGQNLKGWRNRLKKLYAKVGQVVETKDTKISDDNIAIARAQLSPETVSVFDDLVKQHNERIDSLQKVELGEKTNAVADLLSQGVPYELLPAETKSDIENLGFSNMAKQYRGQSSEDTMSYLYALNPSELKDVDLDSPAIRFRLSGDDYLMWSEKKKKATDGVFVYNETQRNKIVKSAFDQMNVSYDSNAGRPRYARFNKILDASIAQFTAENNGRYPSAPELERLVDNLFIEFDFNPSKSFMSINPLNWGIGGNKPIFDAQIDDIPDDIRDKISGLLRQQGLPVTDGMMIEAYMDYMTKTRGMTAEPMEPYKERLTE